MEIQKQLAKEYDLREWQVKETLKLIAAGNTIPFIARYRKEKTGGLSDEVLRNLAERSEYLTKLGARKEQIKLIIAEQGKLTDDLAKMIEDATTLVQVEDYYLPYKKKRRTRATIAKEKGLLGLASALLDGRDEPVMDLAMSYVLPEQAINSWQEALAGARDILAEELADQADIREKVRFFFKKYGQLVVAKKRGAKTEQYVMYHDYEEPIRAIPSHRLLAINRGEKDNELSVKLTADETPLLTVLIRQYIKASRQEYHQQLSLAFEDAYRRLIFPAIEREIRQELTATAAEGAIKVFAKNLRQRLMEAPIKGRPLLALDPAFRTGCKLAVLDSFGKVLDVGVIYPTPPQSKVAESRAILRDKIRRYDVNLVAIGNGTASRETEQFVVDLIKEMADERTLQYVIVNEAGASVYSASKLASKEFPDYDVSLRSAVSIGRRLQDPLAELVKIDPKALGIGQYQHDMDQKALSQSLAMVVEDCVNYVGVYLNTASSALLNHVAGITPTLADNIVRYRERNGIFKSRRQLLEVERLGPKAYEQAAGFLRIAEGDEPLDNTAVHPESYDVAEQLLKRLAHEVKGGGYRLTSKPKQEDIQHLASGMQVGVMTLTDIVEELEKPGRDPRDSMPMPILRSDVLTMADLREGMWLKGVVRNVIDFGAFVDIGVHQDGLVHLSQICRTFIEHPLDKVKVGQVVDVRVISVDIAKKRIGLSMLTDS